MKYAPSRAAALIFVAVIALPGCSRQTAEEKGKALATEKIDLVKGVGEALQEKGRAAAEALTHGAGVVAQGTGKGLEKAQEWKHSNSAALTKVGLSISQVQHGPTPEHNGTAVDAYLIAANDAAGTLSMIAYDVSKRELARTKIDLKMSADEARYETLALDARTPVAMISELAFDF